MKKRIISLMLVLAMMVGMVPMFALNVGAMGTSHQAEKLCNMIPYAYRSAQFQSIEYFQAYKSILFDGYDGNKITTELIDSPFNQIYLDATDSYWDSLGITFSTITNIFFNFDFELEKADIYNVLLIHSLVDSAVNKISVSDILSGAAHALEDFLEVALINENGVQLTLKDVSAGLSEKGLSELSELLYKCANNSEETANIMKNGKIVLDGVEFIIDGTEFQKKAVEFVNSGLSIINSDLSVKGISDKLDILEYILSVLDESNEAYMLIANYFEIFNSASKDIIPLLDEMKNSTDDEFLKESLDKYINILESTHPWEITEYVAQEITSAEIEMSLNGAAIAVKTFLAKKFKLYKAYAIMYEFADILGNVKSKSEYDYLIWCINKFNIAFNDAISKIYVKCMNNKFNELEAEKYCKAYIQGLEMFWRILAYENQVAKGYYQTFLTEKEYNEKLGVNWENHIEQRKKLYLVSYPQKLNDLSLYNNCLTIISKGTTINYVVDGVVFAQQIKGYDQQVKVIDDIPQKEGYTFNGWRNYGVVYYANDVLNKFLEGTSFELNPCFCENEIYFQAQWTQQNTISYNANGGTGAPASHENTVGNTTLSTTVPTRTGHTFLGWSESATGAVKYQPGAVLTKEGNVTLYAVWQPKTFNIIFDANGGVFTAYDNATTVTRPKVYAQNFTFDVTYPVKDGYKCIGWSIENDNTVDWVNGETENDIGAANANDKRVYAVWAASEYVVTYDYNDGSLKEDKVKVPITNNTTYTILSAPKNPDAFKGWMYQDPNGDYWWTNGVWDNGKVSIIQPGTNLQLTGNLTLYAKWDYFVHYNDGTGYTHEAVRDGNDYVIDAPLHTPSGKEFKSWKCEDANGNVAYYKVGDTIDLTTDLTLTATWSDGSAAESYVTVSYDANGGRGSIADDEVVAGGKGNVTLDNGASLSRNGYKFVGWAEEPNAVEHDYSGGACITVDEDLTLYAVWKAVSDETRATVTMSADKEVYKPGDTIILTVLADHSDHFFVDAANTGFNLVRQDGSTEGTAGDFYDGVFTEKNSPSKWYPKNRYENGEEYKVKLYIPNDCSDGTYTISIKVTESILNDTGNGNVDNIDIPIAVTVQIKVDEDYEDKVTVNINKSKVTLHIDDVDTLQATITPSSAKRDLEWYSSNPSIVTVEERTNQKGRIVATGYGTATITAEVNGVKDTCTVVVERCTYDQNDVSSEFLKTPATCSSYAIYYKSCECGYHGNSTFTYTEGGYADHTYSSSWSTDENNHWYAATCSHTDEKKSFGNHVYDDATDTSCNTCGYVRTLAHTHNWATEYSKDAINHWYECSGCTEIKDEAPHNYDGATDADCNTCGYIRTLAHTHNWATEYSKDATNHWYECSGCTEVKDEAPHEWDEGIETTPATETENGIITFTCVCGKIKTETIPATGSNAHENFWYLYLIKLKSQEFDVMASANEGGTISFENISEVKYGKDITYTITPDEGYAIADVVVDGESVGAVSEYTFENVKEAHTITAFFEELALGNSFVDVDEDDWFYEDVEFVYENNLMIGTGDEAFSPNAIVNRAMLVTVLWRLEGSPVVDSSVNFVDVPADEWYTAAVNWAAANGILTGYDDGVFGATKDLTHEQVAAILNRYAVYKKLSENVSGNADDSHTNSEWAENNVLWADINGLFDGFGSDISNLTKGATRAELAAYLRRFCEKFIFE